MLKRLCPVLAAGTIAALAAAPVAFGACGKPKVSSCGVSAQCVYVEQQYGHACAHGAQAIPKGPARKLAGYKGKDKALLEAIGRLGTSRLLEDAGTSAPPSALGAAFDVGFGPTALFAILLGTAIFLVGYSGLRRRRRS